MGARSTSAATAVAGVAGVLGAVTLLTLAASQGSGEVLRGRPGPDLGQARPQSPPTNDPVDFGAEGIGDPGPIAAVIQALVQAFVVLTLAAFVLVILVVAVQALRSISWRGWHRRRREPVENVEFEVVDVAESLTDELVRQADTQREVLEHGNPRNGIVACWNEFERAAARVGHARAKWQTSSEFTLEVLDLVGADGGAVARLAAHYREARFSDHELTEVDRAEARADLEVILAGLGQRTVAT